MSKHTLTFIATAAFLLGCASTDRVLLDSSKRVPTTSVDLYKIGEKPKRPFKEIAILSFKGPREDELKATRHFIEQGKELGANGVILQPAAEGGMRGRFSAYGGNFREEYVFKATAIAYE